MSLLSSFYPLNTNYCFKLPKQLSGTISIRSIIPFDSSTADNNKGKACLLNTFSLSVFKPGSFVFFSAILVLSLFPIFHSLNAELLHAVQENSAKAADNIPSYVLRQNTKVFFPTNVFHKILLNKFTSFGFDDAFIRLTSSICQIALSDRVQTFLCSEKGAYQEALLKEASSARKVF